MERIAQGTLDGRAVELREVSAGVGLAALKTGDGHESMFVVLVHSAHWADTGERVFKDRASIDDNWKMRHLPEIRLLAAAASELNLDVKPDAVVSTNGSGEALPSH